MNIDSLRLFCLVVEEGSVSQAARLIGISQPAVTKQIRQLENTYGTLLFDRTEGKLKLTKAGKTLYPYAKEIVKDVNRSKETIQMLIGNDELKLNVGASLTIGEYFLPRVLGMYKRNNPSIRLLLEIGNTPNILEKLADDVIDIAFVEGVVEKKQFLVEKFADDELILVCPIDHPWTKRETINIEELSKEHMIWRESTSGTRMIVEQALKKYGVLEKIENFMELGSTQAIKSAVEAGLGITILPRITVEKELEHHNLAEIKIKGVFIHRNLWMVQKPQRFSKQNVEAFIRFFRTII